MEIPIDINRVDYFSELTVLQEIIFEGSDTALQALQCIKSVDISQAV